MSIISQCFHLFHNLKLFLCISPCSKGCQLDAWTCSHSITSCPACCIWNVVEIQGYTRYNKIQKYTVSEIQRKYNTIHDMTITGLGKIMLGRQQLLSLSVEQLHMFCSIWLCFFSFHLQTLLFWTSWEGVPGCRRLAGLGGHDGMRDGGTEQMRRVEVVKGWIHNLMFQSLVLD